MLGTYVFSVVALIRENTIKRRKDLAIAHQLRNVDEQASQVGKVHEVGNWVNLGKKRVPLAVLDGRAAWEQKPAEARTNLENEQRKNPPGQVDVRPLVFLAALVVVLLSLYDERLKAAEG